MVKRALNEHWKQPSYEQQVIEWCKYFTDNILEDHRFHQLIATPKNRDDSRNVDALNSGGSARIAAAHADCFIEPMK